MKRSPYILKKEELDVLLEGLIEYGDKKTYLKMKDKVSSTILIKDDLDDMLMDMHDTVLEYARNLKENKENSYKLASILRKLAHEVYYEYIRSGEKRDNERFLRVV